MAPKRPPDLPLPSGANVTLVGEDVAIIEVPLTEPTIPPNLSPAEAEIAGLVFDGLSNREIASHRRVSAKTVGNQLEKIYRKLNIASRTELILKLKGVAPPDE